jgi:hypothetical protein
VLTDANTIFDGTTGIAGTSPLAVSDIVEVSGLADAVSHVIHATRVEKKAGSGEVYDIKGTVSSSISGSFTLTPEGSGSPLTVLYTGLLLSAITDGSVVEVRFTSISGSTITTTADNVTLEKHLEAASGERMEVSGVVSGLTAGASSSTFTVDGVNVAAANSLLAGVANGSRVEVKGTMGAGVLTADVVKTEVESDIELAGTLGVGAVDGAAGTFTLDGVTLTVLASTIFADYSSGGEHAAVTRFAIGDLAAGNHLEVKAYLDNSTGTARVVASKVKRDLDAGTFIQAAPSAASAAALTLLGVSVDITGATFKDAAGAAVATGAAFAALITPTVTIVKAVGSFSGPTLVAASTRIKN